MNDTITEIGYDPNGATAPLQVIIDAMWTDEGRDSYLVEHVAHAGDVLQDLVDTCVGVTDDDPDVGLPSSVVANLCVSAAIIAYADQRVPLANKCLDRALASDPTKNLSLLVQGCFRAGMPTGTMAKIILEGTE